MKLVDWKNYLGVKFCTEVYTLLKNGVKELDSAQHSHRDAKEKLEILRAENATIRTDLEGHEKCLTKMESKISNLEAEREQLLEEMFHFENEKKRMEKKWKDRTNVIELLEQKVTLAPF